MDNTFPRVDMMQNSYRASEFENAFDELAMCYEELLNGNMDNVEYALQLIVKYQIDRDRLGFEDPHEDEEYV